MTPPAVSPSRRGLHPGRCRLGGPKVCAAPVGVEAVEPSSWYGMTPCQAPAAFGPSRSCGRGCRSWCSQCPGGKRIDGSTISKLVSELGIAAVPRGFRSSFRDGCGSSSSTAQGASASGHGKSYLTRRRRGGEGGGGGLLTGRAIPSAYRWAWCPAGTPVSWKSQYASRSRLAS